MTVKTKELLKRSPLPAEAPIAKIESLATQAKLLLGYDFLADRVTNPKRLVTVLRELEIEPYDRETVQSYRDTKVTEIRTELASKFKHVKRWNRPSFSVRWKMTEIAKYHKPVPEFALRKAVQIKEACPDARVFVEELTATRRRSMPRPKGLDPFLVVQLGVEKYYIEVWDEAKFESRLY